MKIADVMTKDVATCVPEQSVNDAARIMWERDCGVVPVVLSREDRSIVGVITDRDICIAAYTKGRPLEQIAIGEVMATKVASCATGDDVSAAEEIMRSSQVHRLPVLDDGGALAGIVSLSDLARASARRVRSGRAEVSSSEVGETLAAIRQTRQLEATPAR
jgi:CBS domain-containing protein